MHRITEWLARLALQRPKACRNQILKQWEKSIPGLFPYLTTDEHQAFAKARLTVFRSNVEWLVIFEILAYVGEADAFIDSVYTYGNKVRPSLEWVEFLYPPPGDADVWLPAPLDFEVVLHGWPRRFTPTLADYAEAGINLDEPISGSLMFDRRVQILRLLTFLLPPHKLFFPETKLLKIVGRAETSLTVFLQLHEWHHPAPDEKLEASPCLSSLAHAIAYNQPGLYKCPQGMVNTHWSQWPNYLLGR